MAIAPASYWVWSCSDLALERHPGTCPTSNGVVTTVIIGLFSQQAAAFFVLVLACRCLHDLSTGIWAFSTIAGSVLSAYTILEV